jgi:[protein-PII] uridylyltransferase
MFFPTQSPSPTVSTAKDFPLDAAIMESTLVTSENPIKAFRAALRHIDEQLRAQFYEGSPANELVKTRADWIDHLLQWVWRRFFPTEDKNLALVAVGGYGRGELHPGSDIDIMVLLQDDDISQYRENLESLLTFLWDMGLEVGHSVRSLDESVRQAAADITVATSLMEARLLVGSADLFAAMRELTGPHQIWHTRRFFEAKYQEQQERHHKYHDTAYNLEPDVKEGPGGLRDLQMIGWVSKRHFGATTFGDLVTKDFLTDNEHQELMACRNYLWQVRFALHTLTGRREDRLLFDYQRQLANQFGYRDEGHNLAVEQFMQRYYRTIMALGRLNEMLLQLFKEVILLADDSGEPVIINRRFQARRGFLEVTRPDVFERYPFALLEAFLLLQKHDDLHGIRASTIRLICTHLHLIDDRFRRDIRAQQLFMKILRHYRGVTQQLRRMNQYGVLAAYLPEFGAIVGRMQYDLFHTYTVDQHILFLVRNLRRFSLARYAEEFPLCSALMRRAPKPLLLYVAALYHDIAKGRGGDHSELGAKDARNFCRRHGLSRVDTGVVTWLVNNHLAMSLTAQKKDIDDPQVINEFARLVGDDLHLNYLYLLTVADIRATNPKLWNSWRASLLWELYQATRRALRRGLIKPIDKEERIEEVQQQAMVQLRRQGLGQKLIKELWQGFGDDYFLRYAPDEIVWHTRAISKKGHGLPLILARENPDRGGTEVFVYTHDCDAVFAKMVTTLDRLGLTVLDARIITSNGMTLDSYTVVENTGEPIQEPFRIREIITTLRQQLSAPTFNFNRLSRRPARVLKHFPTSTQVFFSEDTGNNRTVVELITADRPGLLSKIGQAFIDCGVQLQNAKVATIGARAEDIFFITDRNNQPLQDEQRYMELRARLVHYLDEVA